MKHLSQERDLSNPMEASSVNEGRPTPARVESTLWSWASIYKVSFALFALHELGIVSALCHERLRESDIARRFGVEGNLATPLLRLLHAAGILDRGPDDTYTMPPATDKLLPLLTMESRLCCSHIRPDRLAAVVRTGNGLSVFESEGAEVYLPGFVEAMRTSARGLAPHLVRIADLRRCRSLVDLGGADGALACAIVRLVPQMHVTVVDLPRMETFFHEQQANSMAKHAHFVAADLRMPSLLKNVLQSAEVVVLSNILHLLRSEEQSNLLRSIREFTPTSTLVVVYDQFIPQDGPLRAEHFLTADWVMNGSDFCHSVSAFSRWLENLGYVKLSARAVARLPGAIVTGETTP